MKRSPCEEPVGIAASAAVCYANYEVPLKNPEGQSVVASAILGLLPSFI